jgi:hypothetical protein
VTEPTSDKRPETEADSTSGSPSATPDSSSATPDSPSAPPAPAFPEYKGAPLDAEAGPGLGCFYLQVILLVVLLVITPLTVVWSFPSWVSAALLLLTLVILFFVGMTMVFLLRLVAADRRTRRRPLAPTARKTVGDLEEETAASFAGSDEDDSAADEPRA